VQLIDAGLLIGFVKTSIASEITASVSFGNLLLPLLMPAGRETSELVTGRVL